MSAFLRTARSQIPVVTLATLFAMVVVYLAGEGGAKLVLAVLGVAILGVGATLLGNFRLFCLWGLILTLPLDLSYRVGRVYTKLGGETSFRIEISDLFWLCLLAYLVRELWTRSLRGVRVPKVTYLWIALMTMGMGAVILGPWRITALHELVRMVKVALIFIVVCNELRTRERFMQVALALAAAVIIQACAGLAQFVTGSALGLTVLGEADVVSAQNVVKAASVVRIGAFMIHPVIFATFLATLLPICLGMLLARTGRRARMMFVAAVLLGVPTLVLTLSRAGWLTFFVTSSILAVVVMLRPALRRKAIGPLAGVGAVVAVVAIAFSGQITARIFQSNPESEMGRDEWKVDAVRLASVKPILGWGLNSYTFAVPPYTRLGERGAREFYEKASFGGTKLTPVVHNAYLQWFAELGVVGLVLHLWIFVSLILMSYRNFRVRDEFLYVLNAACLAGVVGYLVDLNFGNSLRQGSTLREFWVLAALICGIHYWRLREERPPPDSAVPAEASPEGRPAGR